MAIPQAILEVSHVPSMPSLSLIQPQAVLACYDCFVPVTPLSFQLCNALSNKLSRYPTKTREKILSVFSCILGKRWKNHYLPMPCRKKSMSLLFIICLDRAKLGAIHRSPFFPWGVSWTRISPKSHHGFRCGGPRRLENGVRNWATASISSLLMDSLD